MAGTTAAGGPAAGVTSAEDTMAQLLWRGMPLLLAVVDADGRLGATNPAWQRLLGLGAPQLRGQALLALVHADDHAAARRWLRGVFDGGGPACFSGRWRRADGSHLRLRWTLALRDGLACALGQPDPAPAPAPGAPHGATTPQAAALALQARQQTLRSLARLSSGLSHDVNNLLQVLRNTLELIRQRPGEPRQVAAWAGSALHIIERGAQRTAQLLSFSGGQRLVPQTVQMATLLQGLRGRLERLLGPRTTLQLQLLPDGALATGDAAQLELALLNLALNAVDAMPRGGRLGISLGRAHVEDDAELATGDYITIDVSDSGAGMSATVRERAFEPFFTTKARGRGGGLGLSQVYGTMQQLGGAVRLQPAGGTGLTVRLLLPAAAAPAPTTVQGQVAGSMAPAWQPAVLLVVDDAERRRLLLSAMQLHGYTRVRAADASSARLLIEQQPPDVVVLGLPARPVSPDALARRARRLRPGVGVVRLDALATTPQAPLDMDALALAIARAAAPQHQP